MDLAIAGEKNDHDRVTRLMRQALDRYERRLNAFRGTEARPAAGD